jgi:hypothetical protein
MADSEPRQYAAQFVDVARAAGIEVRMREVSLMAMTDVGLMIGITTFPNPSDNAKKFRDILTSTGLDLHYTAWTMAVGTDETQVGFDLFVGPKPW